MNEITVKIVNNSTNPNPSYKKKGDAGMDVCASIEEKVVIKPLERKLIPTGIRIGLPEGYECQVRPRSGLALKEGISVLNTPGTIDEGYRGEIGIILINLSDKEFTVENGDRIAQLVFAKCERVSFEETDTLDETERGSGGFGHTGVK